MWMTTKSENTVVVVLAVAVILGFCCLAYVMFTKEMDAAQEELSDALQEMSGPFSFEVEGTGPIKFVWQGLDEERARRSQQTQERSEAYSFEAGVEDGKARAAFYRGVSAGFEQDKAEASETGNLYIVEIDEPVGVILYTQEGNLLFKYDGETALKYSNKAKDWYFVIDGVERSLREIIEKLAMLPGPPIVIDGGPADYSEEITWLGKGGAG